MNKKMFIKHFAFALFFILSIFASLTILSSQQVDRHRGQRANVNSVINQLDSNGLRTGLWFEKEKYSEMKTLRCYKNGLPSKFYMAFFGNGNLQRFGESTEDEYSDIWYYFDERGFLVFTAEHIEKNTEYIRNEVGNELFKPDYKEYVIEYHANGEKMAEGVAYFYDEPVYYFKMGEWRYYDKQGRFTGTRIFTKLPINFEEEAIHIFYELGRVEFEKN